MLISLARAMPFGIRAPAWKREFVAMLLSMVACLSGCIEVEQRVRVHDDGTASVKATIKIDPQYEALVLAEMKKELPKKAPPGVRFDFSQRIDGKAAILMEADGAAAAAMLSENGSATITVEDGGFLKKRYEYKEVVSRVSEFPVPTRLVVSLPGSIETVTGGHKTASDTAEFDQTHAKRGDVYSVTSTAFAFSPGARGAAATGASSLDATAWLMPASIASICAGLLLLLAGWFRSRQGARSGGAIPELAAQTPAIRAAAQPAEEAAPVFCTECGAPNASARKFCGQCGHALG